MEKARPRHAVEIATLINTLSQGKVKPTSEDIMAAFGRFLKQMGTAIYNTRTWVVYGEGPTKMGGGEFTSPTALTSSDIRYTKSKDGDAVYAILGGWPGNGATVNMTAVTTSRFAVGSGKVYLFAPIGGSAISLSFTQDTSGLRVTLPSSQPYTAVAYAMKISKTGIVPAPTPAINNGSGGTGGASSTGGTATGGRATGGTTTGGSATGGRATGGIISATGGVTPATGGTATGGTSGETGGTTSVGGTGGSSGSPESCNCRTAPSHDGYGSKLFGLVGLCLLALRRRRARTTC